MHELANKHASELCRKFNATVVQGDYGEFKFNNFDKEIYYFINSIVLMRCKNVHDVIGLENFKIELSNELFCYINNTLDSKYQEKIEASSYSASPQNCLAFQNWCAENLRKNGFEVSQVAGQSANLIATNPMDGHKIVFQCKRWSALVDNIVVQEVVAAKSYYGAQGAAVIATSDYTNSARALAAANNVVMIHAANLPDFTGSPIQ